MISTVIWVVVWAKPEKGVPLRPLVDERFEVGADMLYPKRFKQALDISAGDRLVFHFGGPSGSDHQAQHFVRAGCLKNVRPITQQDTQHYGNLLRLIRQMFPKFKIHPEHGIMFFDSFPPPPNIGILRRPCRQPNQGNNFIALLPTHAGYKETDEWWRKVVPKGCCDN